MTANRSRPTKARRRRTRAEIQAIRDAIYLTLERENPMTVRQCFYALTTQGVIDKTEAEYKRTVVRLLGDMRRSGEIPFAWIADNTRWMRKPTTYTGLAQMLEESTQLYRRDLWHEQDVYVEVWLEKEALAGVLVDTTSEWDVPLMVTRGYPSLSFVHSAALAIARQARPTYLYYYGDYDPSGVDIPRFVRDRITEIAPDADFSLEVMAITPEIIDLYSLPSRPTKRTDSRSKGFADESVELDALPSSVLRTMVSDAIEQHVDPFELGRLRHSEQLERRQLASIVANMEGAA